MTVNPRELDNSPEKLVEIITQTADDRQAGDITILKVTQVSYLTDYFVIMTGFSRTQVRAIADAIDEKVEQSLGRLPLRVDGQTESLWIVQDYGDVIVHIFLAKEREFYNLEAFWGHGERIVFEPSRSRQE
jgi:ribosome-associated protein